MKSAEILRLPVSRTHPKDDTWSIELHEIAPETRGDCIKPYLQAFYNACSFRCTIDTKLPANRTRWSHQPTWVCSVYRCS